MMRLFSVAALCLFFVACSDSDNDSDTTEPTQNSSVSEFDPTSLTLEFDTPPTNGKLPPDLMPPK